MITLHFPERKLRSVATDPSPGPSDPTLQPPPKYRERRAQRKLAARDSLEHPHKRRRKGAPGDITEELADNITEELANFCKLLSTLGGPGNPVIDPRSFAQNLNASGTISDARLNIIMEELDRQEDQAMQDISESGPEGDIDISETEDVMSGASSVEPSEAKDALSRQQYQDLV